MSRMNNQSRSLRIISRQNGWDPDRIEGGGSIGDVYAPRETPFETDAKMIPGSVSDTAPQHAVEDRAGWNKPDVGRETPKHSNGANPFPAMPGSTGSRGR